MTVNYRLHEDAQESLIRIYQHGVRTYGKIQADKYYDRLAVQFEQIAKYPQMYQSVEHIRSGYRRCVCGVESIFYRIVDDKVEIVNILSRQDVDDVL